jgi:hypothetical protein
MHEATATLIGCRTVGCDGDAHMRTWSKMARGMASVAQALGASTMPEMRPSAGQQDSSRYTCGGWHLGFK